MKIEGKTGEKLKISTFDSIQLKEEKDNWQEVLYGKQKHCDGLSVWSGSSGIAFHPPTLI